LCALTQQLLMGIGLSCLDHRLGRPLRLLQTNPTRLSDESLVKLEDFVWKFDLWM
jgi:hypothetical protein